MLEYYNDDLFIHSLKVLWDYMQLGQEIKPCDIIIGCGCKDLNIPVRCAELYNNGISSKILFAGGLGKGTLDSFNKSESEIFRDIAIQNGVRREDIIIENKSTNTGDNFRFGLKILKNNNIKFDSILIVHHVASERRTLSSAKAIIKRKEINITSPNISFSCYIELLKKEKDYGRDTIEIIVGDIQRIAVYPQFGWQVENDMPDEVIVAYNYFKQIGFTKYLISRKQIDCMISEYGLAKGKKKNYFY